MIENKFYIRYRLIEVHSRYMSIVEFGSLSFVLGKDGSFEPTADVVRAREKAAWARRLLDNYTAMLLGPGSHFWQRRIPLGLQLYLTGKAKPSACFKD